MKNYSEISNRYMKQNKKRTLLTCIGITLATILIFAVGTFLLSFRASMLESEKINNGDWEFQIQNLPTEALNKIKNNAEVKDSATYIFDMEENYYEGSKEGIFLEYGNKEYFEKIHTNEVKEGRYPEKEGEALVSQAVKVVLNLNVGDSFELVSSNGEVKNFEVVGVEVNKYYSSSSINILSYLDDTKLNEDENYNLFVNLKSEKNKQEIINKILEDNNVPIQDKVNNSTMLYLTGNGANEYYTSAIQNLAIFVIATIIVCTIVVIYNSFNISVIERMKYFGILKAIGATPKQIRRIIYKEGALMGLLSFPIGCVIGFLSLKYGIKIFIGDSLMEMENFTVSFFPSILVATALLVGITIYLSILAPARKANKISAVDAIRNKNDIKLGKIKRRKNRIVSKIFGIEGSIAYKNIRRTPFRFIITVLALTVSLVMFNVFYGFIDYTKQISMQQLQYCPFDSQLVDQVSGEGFNNEDIKEIESNVKYDKFFKYKMSYIPLPVEIEDINEDFERLVGRNLFDKLDYTDKYKKAYRTQVYAGGNDEMAVIERYITEGEFNTEKLKNNGVILLDGNMVRLESGEMKVVRGTKYKVGDKIKIPKMSNYNYGGEENDFDKAVQNEDFIELEIIGIASKDPIMGTSLYGGPDLMIHEDVYKTFDKDFNYSALFFQFGENDNNRLKAIEYFNSVAFEKGYNYSDIGDMMKEFNDIFAQAEFFVYCFIIIVSVISVVNIFNTISTNLLLRKRDFSTLKAIGMTEKQLRKSVLLEGTLYGIVAAIFGGSISAILLKLLVNISVGAGDITYNFDFIAFSLSIICAILVTFIATVIPMNKLKKLTIVEGINEEE